jgi:RNA polymerase sigma factor (sigma-70 family)
MTSPEIKRRMADWFRQWRLPLRKFLLGRAGVPAADIDDVAQEVFLRLLRYERAELIEQPQAYLFKMATNVAAEWSIRSRYRRPHDSKWLLGIVADGQPDEEVLREAARDEVERAVNLLTGRQREILKLFFSEGIAQAEIANRLGATPRSVRRHLAKSYEKLRHELDVELLGAITHGRE